MADLSGVSAAGAKLPSGIGGGTEGHQPSLESTLRPHRGRGCSLQASRGLIPSEKVGEELQHPGEGWALRRLLARKLQSAPRDFALFPITCLG